ncbi:MAG: alpha/beta hydrolase [Bacillota bacterium]|nr:alpha/beta hydrolase [Bacillota bacterium]
MKALNILGIIIITILVILIILLIASMINHKNQLRKEAKEYQPPGSMVEVNKKIMHVYAEGEGDITLLFMAGHGTSNPTLDFKPLWMKMTDKFRIAVVERSGYGWSETSNSPRDIDTILEETRKALELSGEKGPYVLFPHSMSGLEAIYWAQKYPEEVKAIIGLDPVTPEAIDVIPKPRKVQLYLMYFISRIGLSRFMPEAEVGENLPLMKSNELSENDKNQYLAGFYKSAFTKDMLSEVNYLKNNAETVAENEIPTNTPMFFFISDDQEVSAFGWKEALTGYLSKINIGEYMHLDTGHYVHYDKSDIIAGGAKAFLEELK